MSNKRLNDKREVWVVEKFEDGEWRFWDSRRQRASALAFLGWNLPDGKPAYRVVRYVKKATA